MPQPALKKIVVLGPESTGKSTLCQQLALHYNTLWCPEYAREYLLAQGNKYTYHDLLTIAKGQIKLEEEYTRTLNRKPGANLLFLDTDMQVMKVWCQFVFGQCHPYILNEIATRKYDLYLLCNTDLPWVKDELREYPDLKVREQLYEMYKQIMKHQTTPWVEIKGSEDARLQMAIHAVENLIA